MALYNLLYTAIAGSVHMSYNGDTDALLRHPRVGIKEMLAATRRWQGRVCELRIMFSLRMSTTAVELHRRRKKLLVT